MGRIIGNSEDRPIQVSRKWKELKKKKKRWVLKKASSKKEKTVSVSQQPLTKPERRRLIHSVYGMIRSRGIQIPYSEVHRVLSSRIVKWNRRFWIRQARDKPAFDEESGASNDSPNN